MPTRANSLPDPGACEIFHKVVARFAALRANCILTPMFRVMPNAVFPILRAFETPDLP
jgi:hypothetical protein